MNEVAAPLFRFFLADARTAAREGDSARMRECLALALDFAPEGHRERVLLAAAELLPAPIAAAPPAGAAPLVVKLADSSLRCMGRIAWEDQDPVGLAFRVAAQPALPPRHRRRLVSLAAAVGLLASVAAVAVVVRLAEFSLPGRDVSERAARTLQAGDGERALAVLAPLGADAAAGVWLLRGRAHIVRGDTLSAVIALVTAAARDSDGGQIAMEAAVALADLGAVKEAADASLYAVTPERSAAELEQVAVLQERAGQPERARRVRQP